MAEGSNTTHPTSYLTSVGTIPHTHIYSTPKAWPYKPIVPRDGYILLCIFLGGLFMNFLALEIMRRVAQKYKGSHNKLIIALGCSDATFILLGCMPTLLVYLNMTWVGGNPMCQFQGFICNTMSVVTGVLTVALAVDRLIAVTRPFLYRQLVHLGRHWFVVVGAIGIGVTIGVLPLLGIGRYHRNLTGTYCTIDMFAITDSQVVGAVIYGIVNIVMISVTLYCNLRVLFKIRIVHRTRNYLFNREMDPKEASTSEPSNKRVDKGIPPNRADKGKFCTERNLAITVLAISVVYLVCCLPFTIRVILNLTRTMENAFLDVQTARLVLLNSVINPFIYIFCRKKAKQELFVLIKSKFSRKDNKNINPSANTNAPTGQKTKVVPLPCVEESIHKSTPTQNQGTPTVMVAENALHII